MRKAGRFSSYDNMRSVPSQPPETGTWRLASYNVSSYLVQSLKGSFRSTE